MKTTVEAKDMIEFLQYHFDVANDYRKHLGANDERTENHFAWCIGMKELVEYCIGAPVNLRMDTGKVTIGYGEEN